jgi:hypothetical protein
LGFRSPEHRAVFDLRDDLLAVLTVEQAFVGGMIACSPWA